jgi:hypothetical protein
MLKQLWNDEAGFIVSAELVLISTLLVIGLIVGLSEVQHAIIGELCDVSEAIGGLNQGFFFTGFRSFKHDGSIKALSHGSLFRDRADECDQNECDLDCLPPRPEPPQDCDT